MSKRKPDLKLVEDTGSQLEAEDFSVELPPQQSEMPFAVVEGEPVTQLPRDLYIPPDALQVFLEAFEGPLDLLLYLIRKQNLDILDIPIAEITRQYMKYIEVMADLQLELAGEYLLMAAMLAEIKSRMLLPRPPSAEGHEEDDPRAELVRRLQEYERFKKAAEDIDQLKRLERDTIPASAELEERQVVRTLPDVTLQEMLSAFKDVLSRAEKFAHHHISRERLSQRERMSEILSRLQTVAFFEFSQLFRPEEGRMGVTVTFIAILELMKEGLIEIVQAEAYAPIHVRTAQRHLKVVQGGVASETADAENAAALSQPELAGENDVPEEDDEPVADQAAVAVAAAVADVAAASSIAVDSVESVEPDPSFVEAAVSEAIAATENAVEIIAAEGAPVAEVTGETMVDSVAEITAAAEIAEIAETAVESIVESDNELLSQPFSKPASELGSEPSVEENFASSPDVASETESALFALIETVEEHVVEEHVVAEQVVEEHVVPEHVVELTAIDPLVEQTAGSSATENFASAADVAPDTESALDEIVDEDIGEEHEAAELVVEEDVVAERADDQAFEPAIEQTIELTSEDLSVEPVTAGPELETELSETDDEYVLQDNVVAEHAVDPGMEPAVEPGVDENLASAPDLVPQTDSELIQFGEETIEEHVVEEHVVPEHVVAENVVPEHVVEEQDEQAGSNLSVGDDTVTGSSNEADNSDVEPSR